MISCAFVQPSPTGSVMEFSNATWRTTSASALPESAAAAVVSLSSAAAVVSLSAPAAAAVVSSAPPPQAVRVAAVIAPASVRVHTLTRDSENDRQRVDQIALLDMALRFNPDVIVVGEMRGPEANAAQEAARTGVAVITTIHSNSCEATYRRMVSLCKRAVDMSDETLMAYVTEAYPIVAFCKQLENRQRRLMEIMECEICADGSRQFRPLFQYEITENRMEEGKFIIEGSHRRVNPISEGLARRLTENGMPGSVLERLKGGVEQ